MVIQTAPKKAAAKRKPKGYIGEIVTSMPSASAKIHHVAEPAHTPVDEPKRRGRAPSGQVIVTFRMDPEVRDKLQAEGPGWGARANSILKQALGL